MSIRENYDPYKRLAAAVIYRAIQDARGEVSHKTAHIEHTMEEAQNFLKGGMLPWSEMLDFDKGKVHRIAAEICREDKNLLRIEEAKEFLRNFLSDGARPSKDVREQAEMAAISWATLRRAKKKLGVCACRRGQEWLWEMP